MKDEYDFSKAKRRGKKKTISKASKRPISLRVAGNDLADIKNEAERLGMPYQTLINSILHQYITGQLVERREK